MKAYRLITTIYCWIVVFLVTVIIGSFGVILSIIAPKHVIKYATRPWGYCLIRGCGIKVRIEGLDNIPDEPCVIMYNHQSAIDIPFYCGFLPIEWRAIMKDDVAKIPFVGWVSKLTGQYFVARDGSKRDTEQVKNIAKQIRNGPPVILAPEGTRSPDGKLLPFQKGGFIIALLARIPVVPVVISGGYEIMPKGSLSIKPGTMSMKIFPAIDVKSLPQGKAGREELESLVRDLMMKGLGEYDTMRIAS
ncbi:MAG TPA: lysophospholipid acyltransferase family protein [Thermodesulfobacteriota bacterium]